MAIEEKRKLVKTIVVNAVKGYLDYLINVDNMTEEELDICLQGFKKGLEISKHLKERVT